MIVVTPEKLEASLCRDSLFDFVQRFWSSIIPEKPVWNWHIEYLCGELQAIAERVFKREPKKHDLIINISPGTTKSTICSIMFPAWCWTRDPTIHSICGSYAFPLALELATYCIRVLTSDKYRRLFPEVELDAEAKGLVRTTKGGRRIATSTGGSITGMHGHIIIIDDPINPKEAVSDVQLKAANEWFDHTLMTRKVDKSVTPTILIMQRLHQTDPTGHLLEQHTKESIRHINLPASLNDKVRPRSLRKRYINGLFDPVRLSQTVLNQSRVDLGEYAYAGQFMQTPIPMGGGMFRTDMIQVRNGVGRMVQVVRYWDKAGTGGDGCFTVGTKMGRDTEGKFCVMDVVRGQWEAAEREKIIKQTAISDTRAVVVGVECEPGSGGKESAQSTVKNLAGFRVRVDKPMKDKITRADPYAVQVNSGNVYLAVGEWNRELLAEMQFFPFSRYKDQIDASSGAFAMLTKPKLMAGGFAR